MGSERLPATMGGDGRTNGVTDGHIRTRHVDGIRALEQRDADVRLTLPARPENVAVVRHVLAAFAEALHLPAPVVDDMRLAVTEACTNVVRHAYDDAPGPLEIVIRPAGDVIDVIVSDRGRGVAPSPDRAGPGLGLSLIAALAHRLEVQQAPAGSRLAMSFPLRPAVGAA